MNAASFYWKVRNSITEIQCLLQSNSIKEELKANKLLKDKYKGKRCFILGNGPSLNYFNLEPLKSEFVFCTNEFIRYPKIGDIQPDFYVIADPKFFELDVSKKGDKEFIEKINGLVDVNPDIKLFMPIKFKEKIKEYKWCDLFEIHYFLNKLHFIIGNNKKICIDRVIPNMQAVVQYCIVVAVYLGFDEIYMLGTDQTNIFGNLRAFLNEDAISDYAFDMNDEERKWKHQKLTESSLVGTLKGYARIFEIYDALYIYCKNNGVQLYNCAPESLIQDVPKKDFSSIF